MGTLSSNRHPVAGASREAYGAVSQQVGPHQDRGLFQERVRSEASHVRQAEA